MQFKKILIAIDNSEHSKKAVRAGIQLAKKLDAQIAMVCGVEFIPSTADNIVVPLEILKMQKEEATKSVAEMVKLYDGSHRVEQFIPEGSVKDEILASADRWNADIIVGSSRVDLQACKLEYSIVSPK